MDPQDAPAGATAESHRWIRRWAGPGLVALSTVIFAARLFWLIDQHGVDLFVHDQWDIYDPVFQDRGLWAIFNLQHGPHRQGIGMLLMVGIDHFSGWNVRAQGFAAGVILLLALAALLALKRRLFGRLTAWDAIIPMVVLTPAQWHHFTGVINLSHSIVPLLLVVLWGCAWTIQQRWLRYTCVIVTNFLAIFTGFAIFIGALTPIILLIALIRSVRARQREQILLVGLAMGSALASVGLFFVNYTFNPALPEFVFPLPRPMDYLEFAARQVGRFCGYHDGKADSIAIGVFMLLAMVMVAGGGLARAIGREGRERAAGVVLFGFAAFSLLFIANAAIGRAPSGVANADVSRYVTLVIPGFMAVFLGATLIANAVVRRSVLVLLTLLALSGHARTSTWDETGMWLSATSKRNWIRNWLATGGSNDPADPRLGQLCQYPIESNVLEELKFLERNQLSFYRSRPGDEESP